jgi:N-acetylglutamate synthase-like GNAT family acetyltransferase
MNYKIKHVTNEDELNKTLNFARNILNHNEIQFDKQCWSERMKAHPELLIYAESRSEVIGISLAYLEDNGNVTIGGVAVVVEYRKHGIAKELIAQIEKQAKNLDVNLIVLGSKEEAEGFYEKIGFTGQLLIQSEKHSVEELLELNPGNTVLYTNIYDGKINQLCLKLDSSNKELQRKYESMCNGCNTQIMFWKRI